MNLTTLHFTIEPNTIEATLTDKLAQHKQQIEALTQQATISWDNLIAPMDDLADELNQFWSPISHLNSVCNNEPLREAYHACLPKLSIYSTELGQNQKLYQAYVKLSEASTFHQLSPAKQKVINNALRDFRLSGIHLSEAAQQTYKDISTKLSALTSKFEENILDATKAWSKLITDETELVGVPEERLVACQEAAERRGQQGWLLTLDYPCYHDIMTYAQHRALREEMYAAYATRASDQGPQAGQFDNSALMQEILQLRAQKAKLLGYKTYAELSLVPKMVSQPETVLQFLRDLVEHAKPLAQRDLAELMAFAKTKTGDPDFVLQSWDVAYYSEQLREQNYAISEETIRPYFPAVKVLDGMFTVLQRLYGISFKAKTVPAWHPDVRFYEIYDADKKLLGGVYCDLYARENKRGGAWMDEAIVRRRVGENIQLPIAYLTCNFSAPSGDKPALLTHNEVETLFHEMGHCLQHLLTQIEDMGVSGINGVPWDAVEFPSQFFEAWCWQPEGLQLISRHYETQAPLPDDLIAKLIAAKNFQAGLFLIRQLEFALFDMTLYSQAQTDQPIKILEILQEIRREVAVMFPPSYHRFPHSFSHIFAGGYAAGYYSYLWAEVLARDAFLAFLAQGIFNRELGEKFKATVLAQGGSVEPAVLFQDFMGRPPRSAALLEYYGLIVT